MKYRFIFLLLLAILMLTGCASSSPNTSNTGRQVVTPMTSPDSRPQSTRTVTVPSPNNTLPVAPAHGGAAPPLMSPRATDQTMPDTSALDARVVEAERKASAKGATSNDKQAAAAAYLVRGNVFYAAGQPRLYKFALGDFRRVLRYDPDNNEARAKMEQIIAIYQSMGRPVPDNGTEP